MLIALFAFLVVATMTVVFLLAFRSTGDEARIDIGRVLQMGFSAIRRNALGFAGLALLFAGVPTFLVEYLLAPTMGDTPPHMSSYGLGLFATMLTGYFLQAIIVRSSIRDLGGLQPDFAGSTLAAVKLFLPIVAIVIITWIATTVGFMLLIVPGVIIYIMFSVAVPVLVEERRGIFGSMGRSRRLTKGSRGRIFALLLIIGMVYLSIVGIVGLLEVVEMNGSFVTALISALTSAASGIILASLFASLYVELRTAKEGAAANGLAAVFE